MSKYNALSGMPNGDRGVQPDARSCRSFNELARDGHDVERHNRFHPESKQRKVYITEQLEGRQAPAIVATDGFGRSAPRKPAPPLRGRPLPRRPGRAGGGREDDGEGRGVGDQAVQDRSS